MRTVVVLATLAICGDALGDDKDTVPGSDNCRFVPSGPAPILIRSARFAAIPLWPPSSSCQARLSFAYRRGSEIREPNSPPARRTAPVLLEDAKSADARFAA